MKKQLIIPDRSVYDNLKRCAKEYSCLCALEYFGRGISYRELIREINRCACALISCGVNRGDVVSVCMPNIPQAVYLFYAINKLGAAADIIDPFDDKKEIMERIEQSGSKYIFALDNISYKMTAINDTCDIRLIVTASVSDEMPIVMKTGHFIKNFGKKKTKSPFTDWNSFISKASPSDRYIAVHETGNTKAAYISDDEAKGIGVTNKDFNDFTIYCLNMCGNIEKADRVLAVIPISQGFGIGTCIHSVFSVGGTAVILPNFNNNDIDKAINRYCPNIIAGNNQMYRAMAESRGFENKDLSFVKTAILAGGGFEDDIKKLIREQLSSHGSICKICELNKITDFIKT